ncbi:MAG TPA: NAD-dependent epimerase/dehydratase family protein [Clostridia bacterium]
MKVVVTGGAGFIGSHITDLLVEKGHEVHVMDNLVHGKRENVNPQAIFHCIDILDKGIPGLFADIKPDILIHHAAQIKVAKSVADALYDAEVNILGSINLIDSAAKAGVKKVIYPSSAAIFGEPEYLPIDEKHPLSMISPYGVSKHTVEHYLDVYYKLYGLKYNVLRYSNVYGSRQDSSGEGGVVAIFTDHFIGNEIPTIFGDGEQVRDFVYVKDVAKANLMMIENDTNGIYNVCTNEETSINYLVSVFNKLYSRQVTPKYAAPREGDIKNSYMSYDKINADTGWKPEYSLLEGLEDMKNEA